MADGNPGGSQQKKDNPPTAPKAVDQQPKPLAGGKPSAPLHLDIRKLLPPEALKSVKIRRSSEKREKPPKLPRPPPDPNAPPPGPVASKVVFLKRPDKLPEALPEFVKPQPELVRPVPRKSVEPTPLQPLHKKPPANVHGVDVGLPMFLVTDTVADLLQENKEDQLINKKLSALIDAHRRELLQKIKKKEKVQYVNYTLAEMLKILRDQGIPCPTNDDYSRLQGTHSRWDPDGTVIEYFTPMLRTFLPINMRGRYRGCWTTDDCIKGLDMSKIPPKRDALEGFVERGRHNNIQEKYREMSPLATDETHLDYLVEIQAYQAEALPIPIFYDILQLGMEVANEHLRILVEDDGYSPNDPLFLSAEEHAQQLRRKIQLYGALGLETLESRRKGLGRYQPEWLKTRDEVIRDIMKRKDEERYVKMQRMEDEANQRSKTRKKQADVTGAKVGAEGDASEMAFADNVDETKAGPPGKRYGWAGRSRTKVAPETTEAKVEK